MSKRALADSAVMRGLFFVFMAKTVHREYLIAHFVLHILCNQEKVVSLQQI